MRGLVSVSDRFACVNIPIRRSRASVLLVWTSETNRMRAKRIRSSSRACGSRRLFAAHGVLEAADRVLHLALDLIGLAFILRLLVSQDLAGPFLHLALGLLGRAFDAIFIYCAILAVGWALDNRWW